LSEQQRLQVSLFLLRIGVFIVMLMWTLDKLVNPEHAAKVFAGFYGITDALPLMLFVGLAELALVVLFLLGLFKRWSYGLVMILHAVSTLSSYPKYLDPWGSLLFFAAWPMLAACIALYLLRDSDTLFTVKMTKSIESRSQ